MEGSKLKIIIVLGLIGIIVFIVMMSISFKNITPLEFGLVFNSTSVTIYDDLKLNGKHYKLPSNEILIFPKTQISFLFVDSNFFLKDLGKNTYLFNEINIRTKRGIKIKIECSAELLLTLKDHPLTKSQQLKQFYENYGDTWYLPVSITIKSVILNEISKYDAINFHNNRSIISDKIFSTIKSKIRFFFWDIKSFNWVNFSYPVKFQNSLEITEITNQKFLEKNFFKEGKNIEKNFKIEKAKLNERIILESKTSNAKYEKVINEKKGDGLNKRYVSFNNILSSLSTNHLSISSDRDITYFNYIACMRNTVSTNLSFFFYNLNFNKIVQT